MARTHIVFLAAFVVSACGGSQSAEAPADIEKATLVDIEDAASPPDPAPLSAEQQATTNAEINLTALSAYHDYALAFKEDTGSYPATKRSFRLAVGAFEDAAEAQLEDGTRVKLDLPLGTEMTRAGGIVYRSNGTDFKLIAQRTGDCSVIKATKPELIDPKREYGPGDCIAYGYWTDGAETW